MRDLPFGTIQEVIVDAKYGSDMLETYGGIIVLKDGGRIALTRSYDAYREAVSALASRLRKALRTASTSSMH